MSRMLKQRLWEKLYFDLYWNILGRWKAMRIRIHKRGVI